MYSLPFINNNIGNSMEKTQVIYSPSMFLDKHPLR
jgi:hypothetical protein